MSTETPQENPALSIGIYGDARYSYSGSGTIGTADGRTYDCTFTAGQFSSGRTVVLAACGKDAFPIAFGQCTSFVGVTVDGSRLASTRRLHEIAHLPDVPKEAGPGVWVALVIQRLELEVLPDAEHSMVKYELTNVALPPRPVHPPSSGALPTLQRITEYARVMGELRVHKDIRVTGELCCPVAPATSVDASEDYVRDVCGVLSVANGTPVVWITSSHFDAEGHLIRRIHNEGITKDYSGHHLIPHNKPDLYQEFLDITLPAYQRKRDEYRLDQGTLASYLDAKAEHDFLELRGVKAVVAMELLRTTMLRIPEAGLSAEILDADVFSALSPAITSAVSDRLRCKVSGESLGAMLAHLPALNRRSFRNHLRRTVKFLGAQIPQREQEHFISCRNKLVHECAFHCKSNAKSDQEDQSVPKTPWAEYCFLVHVLDRLILAMLEYSGVYYDWTEIDGPQERSLAATPKRQEAEQ